MRILRWLLAFLLFFGAVVAAAAAWLQTPSGARVISGWLTKQIQASAPGSRVDLEKIKLRWPPALMARQAVWNGKKGEPILAIAPARVSLAGLRFPLSRSQWEAEGRVVRLDLAALDRTIGKGGWRSEGFMRGRVKIRIRDGQAQDLELNLESEHPGGNLNSEILARLAEMMPPGDARGILLRALGAKEMFHFNVGKVELSTQDGQYVLNLLLDGDHLLDLKVRIPKDSIELLLKEGHRWN